MNVDKIITQTPSVKNLMVKADAKDMYGYCYDSEIIAMAQKTRLQNPIYFSRPAECDEVHIDPKYDRDQIDPAQNPDDVKDDEVIKEQ